MKRISTGKLTIAAAMAALVLTGCQSDEDRLLDFLTSGQSFVEAGDYPRAIIEFRNALQINPDHGPTRAAFAQAMLAQGNVQGALQEYSALAETYPDQLMFRRALGDIAFVRADWTALERHADRAARIAPEDLNTLTLQLAVSFRQALQANDTSQQELIAHDAQKALEAQPEDPILLRIVIEHLVNSDRPAEALAVLDEVLARDPHMPEFQILRIRLLTEDGRLNDAEGRLLSLVALYPEDAEIAGLLAARHVSKGDWDAAEAVLRGVAEGAPITETAARISLARFVKSLHGVEDAIALLNGWTEQAGEEPAAALYAAMARSVAFDAGDRDGAVASLMALLPGIEDTREGQQIKILLAQFNDRLGDHDTARAVIADVLRRDPGNLGALLLRGQWLIEAEEPKDAIIALRTARAQAPRDMQVMALLAAAHEMDGDRPLALEQLAIAAEMSGHAARESERYARALVSEGRIRVAQRVLEAARAGNPRDVGLMSLLAGLYVEQSAWPKARGLLGELRRLDDQAAQDAVRPLEAAILEGEGRRDDGLALVDRLLADAETGQRSLVMVVQSLLLREELDLARIYLDRALTAEDAPLSLRLLDANLRELEGDIDGSERLLRDLTETDASAEPFRRLIVLLQSEGRTDDALAVLSDGLVAHPGDPSLRLIESNRLSLAGDRGAALAILDMLYREDPSNIVVANNLASLLSLISDDPSDLDRAARIAAKLPSDSVPEIADTVGWIAFRRGDLERALPLMERAARGLPGSPEVHLRLGEVYVASGQFENARLVFEPIAASQTPFADTARTRLDNLPGE